MSLEDFIPQEGSEGGAQSQEQVREQQEAARAAGRRAQQAIAQLQKDEKKAKKKEKSLTYLLDQFIKKNQQRDLLNLIVKLLEQNIPVPFILAILSLYFTELRTILLEEAQEDTSTLPQLEGPSEAIIREANLSITTSEYTSFNAETLPPQVKKLLSTWVQDMITICGPYTKRLGETAYLGQHPNSTAIKLAVHVIERLLLLYKIQGEHRHLSDFASFALEGLWKQLMKKNPELFLPKETDQPL